jgi:hypothetical protein
MKIALELESTFNEIADQQGMTDANQRKRTQRYVASRCLMGDALSDEEEKKYYQLIAELEDCLRQSKKGHSKLSELVLMIAGKVYEENSNK